MKIAVLGAGAFGTALGGVLAEKGSDVAYYDSLILKNKLSEVLDRANYIVLCVPSSALSHLLPHLPNDIPLIVATKGIMTDRVFDSFVDWMVLSGPGFADEIKNGQETLLTATDTRIVELFETDYLKFDYTEDKLGVLLCGALKNIYAIEAGYLKLKRNTKKWSDYIKLASTEMKTILQSNKADANTVDLACGVGDLELTCGLPSRNYEYGLSLADNAHCLPEKTVEGYSAIKCILQDDIEIPKEAEIIKRIISRIASIC